MSLHNQVLILKKYFNTFFLKKKFINILTLFIIFIIKF